LEKGEIDTVEVRSSSLLVPTIFFFPFSPDVHPRAPAAAGEEGTEGNRLDEREGVGKASAGGGSGSIVHPWVHKARSMPREEFTWAVEMELTGKEEEPSELIYFKVYKNQIPVIEQALEIAALMLGSFTTHAPYFENDARNIERIEK
jgi:hypothetical protein